MAVFIKPSNDTFSPQQPIFSDEYVFALFLYANKTVVLHLWESYFQKDAFNSLTNRDKRQLNNFQSRFHIRRSLKQVRQAVVPRIQQKLISL